MAKPYFLRILLGFVLFFSVPAADGGSIHDLLRDHGLPAGLLPTAVSSYNLDQDTGVLEAHLDRPCYAKYDGLVFFNETVRGNLSFGGLRGLVGLSQEELFLWLPVKEILVDDPSSGVILFDMGVAHKQLSLSLFENPQDCSVGAGINGKGFIRMIREGFGRKAIGFLGG
ncbi:uncharacterized protein LOC110032159 [Phalaenopsis equestris]|uniref:uncharacterized protein LOC110032159 n=1 Tax=Phalaenopsis equestris TaxID=78828 RepID=UPI0009E52537|nr:uncharacterized protein LOC110032159 [Phalaenopsis equestris]